MKKYQKEVTIVLISHRSKKKVLKFIKKLSKKTKIIIIENSKDKQIKKSVLKVNKKIKIKFSNNKGYGSAINLARNLVNTNYFFVFNPDVKKVSNNLIENFYYAAKKLNNNFGVLGPRFIYPNKKSEKKQSNINKKIGEIHSISGSALFFNKKVFDINKGFDENFFLYFEETDYCVRARKNGYNTYQLNNEKVIHEMGKSVEFINKKEEEKVKDLLIWHFIWSKFYYYRKHYTYGLSLIFFTPTLIRIIFRIIIYYFFRNRIKLQKYKTRLSGLINSMLLKKAFKRV